MGRTGLINAKVLATKSRQNFSLRTQSIHNMEPKTHVLLHFVMFGCIWDRFVIARNSMQNGLYGNNYVKVPIMKSHRNFSP